MPGTGSSKADELEARAHRALDRLETEVGKLTQISRVLREIADKDGANGHVEDDVVPGSARPPEQDQPS